MSQARRWFLLLGLPWVEPLSPEVEQRRDFANTATVGETARQLRTEVGHPWNTIGKVLRAFPVAQPILVLPIIVTDLASLPYLIAVTVAISPESERPSACASDASPGCDFFLIPLKPWNGSDSNILGVCPANRTNTMISFITGLVTQASVQVRLV